MTEHFKDTGFFPLNIAVLTVSDSRTEDDDTSGALLRDKAEEAGHKVIAKEIIPDDVYQLRAIFSRWIADPRVQVVLSTGGTGITGRDSTQTTNRLPGGCSRVRPHQAVLTDRPSPASKAIEA